jgi:hypothetical protein
MNLDNIRRDDWIVGGLALVLAIDLLFFPWFSVSVSIGSLSVSASSTASGSPDGWLGVLAALAALAVVVDLALERLSPQTQVPSISGSRTTTRFVLAVVAGGLMALKFLFHIHFSLFGWGFYLGVVLVVALVYVARQARVADVVAPPRPREPTAPAGPAGPPAGTAGPTGPPSV